MLSDGKSYFDLLAVIAVILHPGGKLNFWWSKCSQYFDTFHARGEWPMAHFKEYNSKWIQIDFLIVFRIGCFAHQFGCNIKGRADFARVRASNIAAIVWQCDVMVLLQCQKTRGSQSKIADFHLITRIQKDIDGLQVSSIEQNRQVVKKWYCATLRCARRGKRKPTCESCLANECVPNPQ